MKKILSVVMVLSVMLSTMSGVTFTSRAVQATMMAADTQVLVLQGDGRLFGWGDNTYGQLGIGDQTIKKDNGTTVPGSSVMSVYTPNEIGYFKKNNITLTAIYCARNTSYAVDTAGNIYACGDNSKGQCGINSTAATVKTWTKMQTAGNTIKAGRVWVKYDVMYVENLTDNNLYVCGSGDNSKTGSLFQGNLRRLYPLGIPTGGLADVQMSLTSTHLLFNSGAKPVSNLKATNASGGVVTGTGYVGPNQYLVTGYTGNTQSLLGGRYLRVFLKQGFQGYLTYAVSYINNVMSSFSSLLVSTDNLSRNREQYADGTLAQSFGPNIAGEDKFDRADGDFLSHNGLLKDFTTNLGDTITRVTSTSSASTNLYFTPSANYYCVRLPCHVDKEFQNFRFTGEYSGVNEECWNGMSVNNFGAIQGGGYYLSRVSTPLGLNTWSLGAKPQWCADRIVYISSNNVYSWGESNAKGQLGGNPDTTNFSPTVNTSVESVRVSVGSPTINKVMLAGATNYVLFNDAAKTLVAQGDNAFGQLGTGSTATSNATAAKIGVLSGKGVVDIFATDGTAVALCGNGDVYAWGSNSYGTVGQGDASASVAKYNTPQLIKNFSFMEGATPPAAPASISVPASAVSGASVTVSWPAVSGATKYILESKKDTGAWVVQAEQTALSKSIVLTTGTYQFRVGCQDKYNLLSPYRTSGNVVVIAKPVKPSNVYAEPTYVPLKQQTGVNWSSTGTGSEYKVKRQINGGSWSDVTTTTSLTLKETPASNWVTVRYSVSARQNAGYNIWSDEAFTEEIQIGQVMKEVGGVNVPSSADAGTEIEVVWDKTPTPGQVYYDVYRSIGTEPYDKIYSRSEELHFVEIVDKSWPSIRYGIVVTDGVEESVMTTSAKVTVNGYQDPNGGGGSGLPDGWLEDLLDQMGGSGTGADGDGLALSTTSAIAQLKKTIFGLDGITLSGRFKTYESLETTGVSGFTKGLSLPVVYRSSVPNLYVSGHLDYNGTRYPIKWGDYNGPASIQNVSGTAYGYVFIPLDRMSSNGMTIPCKLYVQDSTVMGVGGTPRMYYNETFTVAVDKDNPTISASANGVNQKLTVAASDSVSGIARVQYRYKSDTSSNWSPLITVSEDSYKNGTEFSFLRVGNYELKFEVTDNAGNKDTSSIGLTEFGIVSGGDSDGSGGIGSTEIPGSNGLLPGDINVYREITPALEIVIINGTESTNSSFDRKVLEDLFNGK